MVDEQTLKTKQNMVSESRWPGVLGVLGIALGIIFFLDKLDDLFVSMFWPNKGLTKLLGQEMTEFVTSAIPSFRWRLTSFVAGGSLSVMLVWGSLHLLRRNRSGVQTCMIWAWLAIGWALIETVQATVWLGALGERYPVIYGVRWTGLAVFGVLVALAVMVAYPTFLLIWLARPTVRDEYSSWHT